MAKFEVTESLVQESLKALEIARNTGKVRKGTNETTKSVEREKVALVYIANDVQPPEIVAHLPGLCDEKKIPYLFVPNKTELGKASGLDVPTASVSVVDTGKAKKQITEIIEKVTAIRTGKAEKKAAPKAEKKEEKPPEKPKEKKEEKPTEKPEEKKEKPSEKPEEKKAEKKPAEPEKKKAPKKTKAKKAEKK